MSRKLCQAGRYFRKREAILFEVTAKVVRLGGRRTVLQCFDVFGMLKTHFVSCS